MMCRGGIFLALGLALAGCAGQSADKTSAPGQSDVGIVGGTNVNQPDSYSPHVVFLLVQMGDGEASCTGSILDSQTILTAAHCVSGASAGAIVFADNVQNVNALTSTQIRKIDKVSIYPKYKPDPEEDDSPPGPQKAPTLQAVEQALDKSNSLDYDVALIHFSGGLPDGYTPVQLATDASIVQPGAILHMIGYGLSQVEAKSKKVNGHVVVTPQPVESTVGQLRETQVPVGEYDTKVDMILTSGTVTSVCSGDSGGPGFVQDSATGTMVQVGIAEAVATAYCNSVSMHTAVFPYLSWIKQTAAKLAAAQKTASRK